MSAARLLKLVVIEVLIYPALIIVLVGLYAVDLPGLEIVCGLAITAILIGLARGLWMLPNKLRVIWGKTHG